ncbi:MAG: family 20 glycosylhydrolase [Ignavibacteria bacterium]|jgi:hexosaminidase
MKIVTYLIKYFPLFSFFITTLIFLSETKAGEKKVSLIPLPEKLEWVEGSFLLSNETRIISNSNNLTEYLIIKIQALIGVNLNTDNKNNFGKDIIILQIDNSTSENNKEYYELSVSENKVGITAANDEAIFRGIQTFFQLISPSAKAEKKGDAIEIPCCIISDHPKFSWRGLNLDCCRHFMTKDFIKRYIDILAYYKFNTLHWHLTEDQGWRIEIKKYPKLTEIGAWRKEGGDSIYGGFYTQEDIKKIVKYAESRYINIVPEIEMPGHSLASLASYPENSCTGGPFEVTNIWGVHKDIYCAGRDSTFYFLQNILDEVIQLFPGKYIHIGGDEAPKDRWKECDKCQARIKAEGLKDEHELQSYLIKRISNYLHSKSKEVIGWDEILEGGLAPGAIVQSWQSFDGAIHAARSGHFTICSPASHTYLNHDPEDLDLRIAYSFNPVPDELSGDERKFVLGSEANLWTEHAPQQTVDFKLFPRILALSEVFWNDPQNKNYDEFYSRVQTAYDDLSALGIQYGRESKVIIPTTTYDESKKEFIIKVEQGQQDIDIRYTTDGSEPSADSPLYKEPIKVNKSSFVKIAAFKNSHFIGKQYALSFDFHKALNSKLTLINPYEERYRAGGKNALIDGVRGTDNFRDGSWQGYVTVDFEGIIDLGEEKEISKVIPRFILNSNSWIFLPVKVEVELSTDNVTYTNKQIILNDIPQKNSEIVLKDFTAEFENKKTRFIKVNAENIKKCPEWHPGAGSGAWLFIDEIVVK